MRLRGKSELPRRIVRSTPYRLGHFGLGRHRSRLLSKQSEMRCPKGAYASGISPSIRGPVLLAKRVHDSPGEPDVLQRGVHISFVSVQS